MKKVLLISFSTGAGHTQAARALEETIKQSYPQIEARHIDLADFISTFFKTATVTSYEMITKNAPKIWKSLFTLTDNKKIITRLKKLTTLLKDDSFPLYQEILDFAPDHIICTHFTPADLVTHNQHLKHIPLSVVVTDYGLHPIWLVEHVSHYFVATEAMKYEMMNDHHIPEQKITISGIPVHPAFFQKHNKQKTYKKYNLSPDAPLVLVMSGGEGLMRADKVVANIMSYTKSLNIIAIAGRNEILKKQLDDLKVPSHITLSTLGWTDDIPALMSAAEAVVSKPGGMTTSECLVSRTPLIAINPIPGQEEFNIKYLEQKKLGVQAKQGKDIVKHLQHILSENQQTTMTTNPAAQTIIETLVI